MATFTMELREVLESLYGETMDPDDYEQEYESVTFNGVTYGRVPVLSDYGPLGLAYYPIFDEGYRKILNGKIISEYFYREIGMETIEMWKQRLITKMDQVMPFYNQLYESTLIEYGALESMRIQSVGTTQVEGNEAVEGNSANDTVTKSGARVIGSDFPQTMLAGNGDYARTGTDSNSESDVNSTGSQNSESTSSQESNSNTLVTGFQGAASDLIMKYRASLINIDTMVLAEIDDLFMGVLNNGDEYFTRDFFWR